MGGEDEVDRTKAQIAGGWVQLSGEAATKVMEHYSPREQRAGEEQGSAGYYRRFGAALKATLKTGSYQLHYGFTGGTMWYSSKLDAQKNVILRDAEQFIVIRMDDGDLWTAWIERHFHISDAKYGDWWVLSRSPHAPAIP